jgi:hypothetical protein
MAIHRPDSPHLRAARRITRFPRRPLFFYHSHHISSHLVLRYLIPTIVITTALAMTSNGTSSRKWANGPSVPLTTPFREDESIDHEALAKQVVRLAKAGEGIVLLGTNGEGELISCVAIGNC